jgi:hypothetical protein
LPCYYPKIGLARQDIAPTDEGSIDRLQPRSLGGSDTEENLALACNRCDFDRYNFVVGRDLETSTISPLFNPRDRLWQDHFIWSIDATKIIGTTEIGRASSLKLDCNSSYNRIDSHLGARSMNAYKVDAIVTENGLAIGSGLPLPIGRSVEVIILDSETLDRQPVDRDVAAENRSLDLSSPEYLVSIASLMTEWESAADESAYQDL